MSIAIFFTAAACILPWLALYVADWRTLCLATSAPLALSILTPWCIPESARWLVSQNKVEKAIGILRKFEKVNKRIVGEEIYKQFSVGNNCINGFHFNLQNILNRLVVPKLKKKKKTNLPIPYWIYLKRQD